MLTLTSGINEFDEAHSIVHYKLFSIGIFYSWVIRLFCESEVLNEWEMDCQQHTSIHEELVVIQTHSVHFG